MEADGDPERGREVHESEDGKVYPIEGGTPQEYDRRDETDEGNQNRNEIDYFQLEHRTSGMLARGGVLRFGIVGYSGCHFIDLRGYVFMSMRCALFRCLHRYCLFLYRHSTSIVMLLHCR